MAAYKDERAVRLGQVIRQARLAQDLTMNEVIKLTKVPISVSLLSHLEAGRQTPSPDTLRLITNALDLDYIALLEQCEWTIDEYKSKKFISPGDLSETGMTSGEQNVSDCKHEDAMNRNLEAEGLQNMGQYNGNTRSEEIYDLCDRFNLDHTSVFRARFSRYEWFKYGEEANKEYALLDGIIRYMETGGTSAQSWRQLAQYRINCLFSLHSRDQEELLLSSLHDAGIEARRFLFGLSRHAYYNQVRWGDTDATSSSQTLHGSGVIAGSQGDHRWYYWYPLEDCPWLPDEAIQCGLLVAEVLTGKGIEIAAWRVACETSDHDPQPEKNLRTGPGIMKLLLAIHSGDFELYQFGSPLDAGNTLERERLQARSVGGLGS